MDETKLKWRPVPGCLFGYTTATGLDGEVYRREGDIISCTLPDARRGTGWTTEKAKQAAEAKPLPIERGMYPEGVA